jgi:hypothetical protein
MMQIKSGALEAWTGYRLQGPNAPRRLEAALGQLKRQLTVERGGLPQMVFYSTKAGILATVISGCET